MPTNRLFSSFKYLIALSSVFILYTGYLYAVTEVEMGQEEDFEEEIGNINTTLKTKRQEIEELKKQAGDYRKQALLKRSEALTLKNQIFILDTDIAKLKLEQKAKEQEIELTELDISETENHISLLTKKIQHKKEQIAELLRVMYQNDQKNVLQVLLMNDSLSDFFNEAKYLENVNTGLYQRVIDLKKSQDRLETERVNLIRKKEVIEAQKLELVQKKEQLEDQELTKEQILRETNKSERKFRKWFNELQSEQDSIENEIVSLEKNLRAKLEAQEKEKSLKVLGIEPFIWPVKKDVITAYFHDPSYPFRRIFEHPAVDIRAAQGSPVAAAASGYVAKTRKDPSCTGRYAYIMIIHANGFSTVYGHLSAIEVEEGQIVTQGQRIALSGGKPGTCGAGNLTTGAHHHFEIRLNGIPVDPLQYLR